LLKPKNMIIKKLLPIFACILLASACKKDKDPVTAPYNCAACVTAPEALVANNASSKGIYKGVLIGSTGTIKFNVANNGTDITAIMVIDGTTINLSSTIEWTSGAAYVAPFTGTYNGSPVTVNFSVGMDGSNPIVTSSDIPGHAGADFLIIKETSTSLVEAFIGTYHSSLPEDGVFNILLNRSTNTWNAIARENGETNQNYADGTINNNVLINGSQNIGTLNGDDLNGSFMDANQSTITITGKRVL
jgi:hypothetical protein